ILVAFRDNPTFSQNGWKGGREDVPKESGEKRERAGGKTTQVYRRTRQRRKGTRPEMEEPAAKASGTDNRMITRRGRTGASTFLKEQRKSATRRTVQRWAENRNYFFRFLLFCGFAPGFGAEVRRASSFAWRSSSSSLSMMPNRTRCWTKVHRPLVNMYRARPTCQRKPPARMISGMNHSMMRCIMSICICIC